MESEVAKLREQLELEYWAGMLAIRGLSFGGARHQFITKQMENMGAIHDKIARMIGGSQ